LIDLILGYGAGLLTLVNPCVLPVLPIVLAGSLQTSRLGPLALVSGMGLAFVALGMLVPTLGYAFGITADTISTLSALLMIGFGLVLLLPNLGARFAGATAGVSASADGGMRALSNTGLRGEFLGGMLLGAVWSPCVGPTLGGAMALASQGRNLLHALLVMVAFALGVATVMLAFGYGARSLILRRQETMRAFAARARPLLGGVFALVGIGLLFHLNLVVEGWLLDILPAWLQNLSVSI